MTTLGELARYVRIFMVYNMVLAEIDEMGNLEVLAWGASILQNPERVHSLLSRFKGPEAVFSTQNDRNALVFRNMLDGWPFAGSTSCVFLTVMTAPYNFVVMDESTGRRL